MGVIYGMSGMSYGVRLLLRADSSMLIKVGSLLRLLLRTYEYHGGC